MSKVKTYDEHCEECKNVSTDIDFFITNHKGYGGKFKNFLKKLVKTEITDMSFFNEKKQGDAIKKNSILAITLKQKYDNVVLRCVVQHGKKDYVFHCYAVVNFKGKGLKQRKRKNIEADAIVNFKGKQKKRKNIEAEYIFDVSQGRIKQWPYEFYHNNLYGSTYLGKAPEFCVQDIPVFTSMNFEWLMLQTVESKPFQWLYNWKVTSGKYSCPYNASSIMSLLLNRKMTIVKKKQETLFLVEEPLYKV